MRRERLPNSAPVRIPRINGREVVQEVVLPLGFNPESTPNQLRAKF